MIVTYRRKHAKDIFALKSANCVHVCLYARVRMYVDRLDCTAVVTHAQRLSLKVCQSAGCALLLPDSPLS